MLVKPQCKGPRHRSVDLGIMSKLLCTPSSPVESSLRGLLCLQGPSALLSIHWRQ